MWESVKLEQLPGILAQRYDPKEVTKILARTSNSWPHKVTKYIVRLGDRGDKWYLVGEEWHYLVIYF
jgi:hypothetical protein